MKKGMLVRRAMCWVALLAMMCSLLMAGFVTVAAQGLEEEQPGSSVAESGTIEGTQSVPASGEEESGETSSLPQSQPGSLPEEVSSESDASSDPEEESALSDESDPASVSDSGSLPDSEEASSGAQSGAESAVSSEMSEEDTADIMPMALPGEWENGWTEYTDSGTYATTFAVNIAGDTNYTGNLRVVKGSSLKTLSYALTYNDGVNAPYTIDYGYSRNSFSTTRFGLYDAEGNLYDNALGELTIVSIWTKETTPGYPMVQARGMYTSSTGGQYEVRVTMIPYVDGLVVHQWDIINLNTAAGTEETLSVGMISDIDTQLEANDRVPVHSLGTGRGMYIADPASVAQINFPQLSATQYGYDDYAAGPWARAFRSVFGTDLATPASKNAPLAYGDVMHTGSDSSVYFRWNVRDILPGQRESFAYGVSIGPRMEEPVKYAPTLTASPDTIEIVQGEDAETDVTWADLDSDQVDLYQQMEDGDHLIGTVTENTVSLLLPLAAEEPGTYLFVFYVVDPDGNISNLVEVYVTVTAVVVSQPISTAPAEEPLPAPSVTTTSPQTGDSNLLYIGGVGMMLSVLLAGGALLVYRKTKETEA